MTSFNVLPATPIFGAKSNRPRPSLVIMPIGALNTKALSAASKGDLTTLKSLKEQLNLSECCDKFGATPVHYAARAGKVDCLRWLIQTAGASGNKPANNGASPAHDAAATGQLDCLQWLIQNGGCSSDSRDACGATPLHLGQCMGGRGWGAA